MLHSRRGWRPLRTRGIYTASTSPWSRTVSNRDHFDALTVEKRKKLSLIDRPFGAQGGVWDRYGDSPSTTSAEESGRRGSQSKREKQRREWPPWPPSQTEEACKASCLFHRRGSQRRESLEELDERGSSKCARCQDQARPSSWNIVTEGATASQQPWGLRASSDWSRPSTWAAPASINLTGQDHATDHAWYQHGKWYASGWANDPSHWSQSSKRAKPTPIQKMIDSLVLPCRMDLHPRRGIQDRQFRSDTRGQPRGESSSAASASASATHYQSWRPRDDAARGYSSAAGDTSEGSDEISNLDEESLRKIADRVNKALAAKGSGQ